MSPRYNAEGKPFGPWQYNEIIKECYYISKQIHTSYTDLMDVTPAERKALLLDIQEDIKRQNEMYEKAKKKKN